MKKQIIIKIILVLLSFVTLIIFSSKTRSVDSSFSDLMNRFSGELKPDSNIVIIHLTSSDIEQLGPWPLKRSYYALLIHHLKDYKVKKIGLEIFLSAKFVSQVIYDNVLQKEIQRANNVVLSSVAGNINDIDNLYKTDSLSLPSPKLIDDAIHSGHINYLKKDGIIIPLEIINQDSQEKAFSLQLLEPPGVNDKTIKLNFISSWHKFKNYSLSEFFQLVQDNSPELLQLKDKIILIGVSDPQLSSVTGARFDDVIPGVALHAFALDNLLNQRFFNDKYYNLSIILFGIFLIAWIILSKDKNQNLRYYIIIIAGSLLIFYVLNRFLYIELAYSYLIIPLAIMFFVDVYYKVVENRKQLKGYYNEAVLLKNLIANKEKELSVLQRELNQSKDEKANSLLVKINNLKENINKIKENQDDQKLIEMKSENNEENFLGLVFKSDLMKNVAELIKKAAPADAAILITGESGTGKELVAKAIHSLSKRSNNKFVAVNCAALTETLLESELFGHVKGAFTGAVSDKIGKFEAADKGTIFLDEIGETSENFQAKLLRVLQFGEFDKVGSVTPSKVDVRIISATNKDLKQRIKENKFREDLYYRLNVINIHLPSLKERTEDIEPLIKHFIKTENDNINISLAALNCLQEYEWKGNVRELESVIKRAVVFCKASDRKLIQLNDLPEEIIKSIKLNFEDLVIESLRAKGFSHSSINETAKELGNVNRTLVAENFRGYSLKTFYDNSFDEVKTIKAVCLNDKQEEIDRVKAKLETWLNNIRKDVSEHKDHSFEVVKHELKSKYKNLPQKFHFYLDEVIKYYLNKSL